MLYTIQSHAHMNPMNHFFMNSESYFYPTQNIMTLLIPPP
jgi:hypothetical protein